MVLAMTLTEPERQAEGARLRGELQVVAGHLNVLHGQMVSIVGQAIATDAWHGIGVRTIEHWLAWRAGVSPATAKQICDIARKTDDLPATTGLLAKGLLSLDQTAAATAHTPVHHDRTAAGMVPLLTVAQIRSALGRRFFPDQPGTSAADETAEPSPSVRRQCSASAGFDDTGEFHLHAHADPAQGALVMKALEEARDALFRAGQKDVTWLDALAEVSRRSMDSVSAWARRDRYKMVVHLDAEGARIHQGPKLPQHVFEEWACDGTVQPLWYLDGKPVNLGRSSRLIPPQTRLVVENRDRICRHPTCTSSVGLAVHHIRHWSKHRGPTDTCNLICLCAFHHHQLHNGTFTIDGNADIPTTIAFTDRNGNPITGAANPTAPTGPPPDPVSPYQNPLGERLYLRNLHYGPPPTPTPPTPTPPRPPTGPAPDGVTASVTHIHDRNTEHTPGATDQAPSPAAGPHAPPAA